MQTGHELLQNINCEPYGHTKFITDFKIDFMIIWYTSTQFEKVFLYLHKVCVILLIFFTCERQ